MVHRPPVHRSNGATASPVSPLLRWTGGTVKPVDGGPVNRWTGGISGTVAPVLRWHRYYGESVDGGPVPPVYYYEESILLFPRVQRGSYEKKLRIGGHVLSQYVSTHFSFLGVIFFSEYKMYLYLHISAVEGQVSRNDERYLFLVDRF